MFYDARKEIRQLRQEVQRLHHTLELVARQVGVDPELLRPENQVPEQVRRLAAQGKKIQAIKLLREHTGLGLADAKNVVDQL